MKITTLKIRVIVLTLLCILTAAIWNGGMITKALTIDQTASPSDGQKTEEGSITGKVQGAEKTFSLVAPRASFPRGWESVGGYINDNVTEGGIDYGALHPPGTGTEADPYLISTPEQLAWFSYAVSTRPSLCGTVTADLDMTGVAYGGTKENPLRWFPIGMDKDYYGSLLSAITRYTGTFDGGGHTISGLSVRKGDFQYGAGLFGAVRDGTIKNIVVKDSKIASTFMGGSIAGLTEGNTVISNCFSNAVVGGEGATFCGGIVGYFQEGSLRIEKCGFSGQARGSAYLGGIVGGIPDNAQGLAADCFFTGVLECNPSNGSYAAGIAVTSNSRSKIINCYSGGKSVGTFSGNTAGIATGEAVTVLNCYYSEDGGALTGGQGTKMSTADMKSGILTGKLNSKSSEDGTTETDSLRADRLWYSDHYFGTAGKEKGNQGFPDLIKSPYQGWEEVAIEMANPAGQVDSDNHVMTGAPPVIKNGVYQITGPEQFAWFSRMVNIDPAGYAQANLKVTADLDISGTDYAEAGTKLKWLPIGKAESGTMVPYTGNADGGNFRIKGMYVEAEGGLGDSLSSGYQIDAGLFRYTDGGGTISNFILTDGSVKGKSFLGFIGALVGRGQHTTITNCFNESVSVSAPGPVGGLVGGSNAANFVINQCGNRAAITGEGNSCYAGGIVGRSQGGQDISNCYNVGTIISGLYGGGIIGLTKNNTKIRNCYTTATITADGLPYGGLAGSCDSDTLENCYYEHDTHDVRDGYTGLTTAELQSWGAVWLLNGKKYGVWRPGDAANRNYPMFGSGGINWQQIGEAADSGLLDGFHPFTTNGNTEATAYQVETPEQLAWFLYKVNTDNANYKNKCLKLMNTINLYGNKQGTVYGENIQWVPIRTFSGTFDGNGFQIQDIRMSTGGSNKAFIWDLVNGSVKNLTTTGYIYAQYTAGIALNSDNSTIKNCTNYVTRKAPAPGTNREYGGGITYRALNGTTITRCVNRGVVQRAGYFYYDSNGRAGGIAAILEAGCVIRDCYNRATQDANSTTIGGIVSDNRGMIENCYNTGGTGDSKYGVFYSIAAFNSGIITNCYYTTSNTDNTGSTKITGLELSTLGMAYRLNAGRTGTAAAWTTDADSPQTNNGYAVLLSDSEPFNPVYRNWQDVGSVVDVGGVLAVSAPTQTGDDESNAIGLAYPEQLAWFLYKTKIDGNYQTKFYKLTADMNMSGFTYNGQTAVGDGYVNCLPWFQETLFKGNLDGQNHTVSNLYLSAAASYQGFFSQLNGATVKNLTLKSGHIKNTGSYTGGLVGYTSGNVEITNCHTKDLLVEGAGYIGGLIGEVNTGNVTVSKCSVESEVKGTGETGGIVGSAYGSGTLAIEDSYHKGTVSGGTAVGIFARTTTGLSGKVVQITNCYNAGTAQKQISGTNCTVTNCYYDKEAGTTTGDHSNTKGMTTAQLQSWYAAYLLNGRKFAGDSSGTTETAWTSANNTSYPSFGNLAEAKNWQDVGQGIDAPTAGNGSSSSPYQLANPEQLAWFMSWINWDVTNRRTSCALLTADIDLTGAAYHTGSKPLPWRPITLGTPAAGGTRDLNNSYQGTFDGADHTISHMYLNSVAAAQRHSFNGLFGMAKNAEIKNLRMEQYEIVAESTSTASGEIFAGVMVGETNGNVTISRVLTGEGSITAKGMTWTLVAGLVANNESGLIKIMDSASRASLNVSIKSGGLTNNGYCAAGMLSNRGGSYATATIVNSYYAGTAVSTGPRNTIRSGQCAAAGSSINVTNLYYDSSLLTAEGYNASSIFGTGVPTAQMQDGYITGKMNSIDSGTGAAVDSLRDNRTWYSDHLYSGANASKGNNGYPDFTRSLYTSWGDVGAEVATAAGKGTYGDIPAAASYTDTSDGSTVTGYNITKPEQLAWLAYQVNQGLADPGGYNYSAFLGTGSSLNLAGSRYMDSSLTNFPWTPIGSHERPYAGRFHGKNCEISKMYINTPTSKYQGLFGSAQGGMIRNVGIGSDCSMTANGVCAGVAGEVDGADVFQCWNRADIISRWSQVGGIVGYHSSTAGESSITECWNTGNITLTTTGYVGGIVGLSNFGSNYRNIINCYNTGNVALQNGNNTAAAAAGITGWATNTSIHLCYNTGTITGTGSQGTYAIYGGSGNASQCFSRSGSAPNSGTGWAGEFIWSENDMKNGRLTGALNALQWKDRSIKNADSLRDDRLWYQDRSTGGSDNQGYPYFTKSPFRNWEEVGREVASPAGQSDASGNPAKGAQPASSGGSYAVGTPEQLAWISATIADKGSAGITLKNDISLAGTQWTTGGAKLDWIPITSYSGAFDGKNFKVSDLYITSGGEYAGLFGEVKSGGSIKNVTLESGAVKGKTAGGLAGSLQGAAVENCLNRGVTAASTATAAGGLFGKAGGGSKVSRCGNLAAVTAETAGGGLIGLSESGISVYDSYNLGAVGAKADCGGILSTATGAGILRNVYNGGTVSGGSSAQTGPVVAQYPSGGEVKNGYYNSSLYTPSSPTQANIKNQTGLTAAKMKSGYLTGLLNSIDAETGNQVNALRDGRIWYDDNRTTQENLGYPCFTGSAGTYEDWSQVGAQVVAEWGAVDGSGNPLAVTKPKGAGTAAAPYEIETAEQLAWIMYQINSDPSTYQTSSIVLKEDIDLTGETYRSDASHPLQWVPMGNAGAYFKGVLDGGGHVIDFLYINRPSETTQALVGYLDGATIKKLGIGPGSSVTGADYTAAIAARCPGAGTAFYIYDCFNRGAITGGEYSGPIFGDDEGNPADRGSRIVNCYNTGLVTAQSGITSMGAVIGNLSSGTVSNCYYLDTSAGSGITGGIGYIAGGKGTAVPLTDAYMKSGYLPGKLNSVDGASNTAVDSLRKNGRVWGIDRSGVNGGYPLFSPTEYQDWAEVGQEAANAAGAVSSGTAMKGAIPSGAGTNESPYQISTPEQLAWLTGMIRLDVAAYRGKHAAVTANLDLTGADYCPAGETKLQWVPIGYGHASDSTNYSGNFNGQGHVISNLYINRTVSGAYEAGLFGVTSGTISNSYLSQVSITAGSSDNYAVVGGITGQMTDGRIERCGILSGSITCAKTTTNYPMVGGIVGDIHHNTNYILDCFNMAAMSGPNGSGGIVGRVFTATYIRNCYFAGSGVGGNNIYAQNSPTVQNCYYKAASYTAPGGSSTNQQTGLTESQMKNGMLTGLLNSMDGAGGTVTDSLRTTGRVWYQDRGTPAFNSGYPMFIQSDYRNWQEVGAEVSNAAGAASGGTPMAGARPAGDGSSGSPYQIGTPEQLAWLMYLTNSDNAANGGACVELTRDIDLFGSKYSGYAGSGNAVTDALPWMPIASQKDAGTPSVFYTGTFAGNGCTISRLYVPKDPSAYHYRVGMFSAMKGATLTGLKLDETCELNGSDRMGGFVSDISGGTVISDCENRAVVNAYEYSSWVPCDTAGIAGWVASYGDTTKTNKIIRCANYGAVTGNRDAGGIVGNVAAKVEITDCYNRGPVTVYGSGNEVSGIAAVEEAGGTLVIKNCYNTGKLTAPSGRAAYAISKHAGTNCYYDKETSGNVSDASISGTPHTPLDSARMKAWGLPFLLNEKALNGVWGLDEGSVKTNDGYPRFDTGADLRSASDWQEVGQFVGYGLGTAPSRNGGVYQIGTAEQLSWLMWQVNKESGMRGTQAALTENLYMKGADYQAASVTDPLRWIPIGSAAPGTAGTPDGYQGTFDGDFHQVTGLRITGKAGESGINGFFGCLNGAAVKNLLLDVTMTWDGTPASSAGLVRHRNGGVVSMAVNSSLVRCGTTGSLTAPSSGAASVTSGGIVASADHTTVQSCYSRMSYTDSGSSADRRFGGLMGQAETAAVIKNSYFAGTITGPSGGAFSLTGTGTADISDTLYDSQLTGAADSTGKGVGRTTAQMKNTRVLGILNNGLSVDSLYFDKTVSNEGYPVFTAGAAGGAAYLYGANGRQEEETSLTMEGLTMAGDSVYTALVNLRWYQQGQTGESSWSGGIPPEVSSVNLTGDQRLFPQNTRIAMSWEKADGTRGYAQAMTVSSDTAGMNLIDHTFRKADGTFVGADDLSEVQNQNLIFWIDRSDCAAAAALTGELKLALNAADIRQGSDNLQLEIKPGSVYHLALNSSPTGSSAVTAGSDGSLTIPVSWEVTPSAGYAEKGETPYVTVYLTDDAGNRAPFGEHALISADGGANYTTPDNPYYYVVSDGSAGSGSLTVKLKGQGDGVYQVHAAMYSSRLEDYDSDPASKGSKRGGYLVKTVTAGTSKVDPVVYEIKAEAKSVSYDYSAAANTPVELDIRVLKPSGSTAVVKASLYQKNQSTGAYEDAAAYLTGGNGQTVTVTDGKATLVLAQSTPKGTYRLMMGLYEGAEKKAEMPVNIIVK